MHLCRHREEVFENIQGGIGQTLREHHPGQQTGPQLGYPHPVIHHACLFTVDYSLLKPQKSNPNHSSENFIIESLWGCYSLLKTISIKSMSDNRCRGCLLLIYRCYLSMLIIILEGPLIATMGSSKRFLLISN